MLSDVEIKEAIKQKELTTHIPHIFYGTKDVRNVGSKLFMKR
jgi:hypothetical protein